jgi:Flp pilus assembly pilin Flp
MDHACPRIDDPVGAVQGKEQVGQGLISCGNFVCYVLAQSLLLIRPGGIMLRSLVSDRRGATTTEYAILIGLLALVVLGAVKLFGSNLRQKINSQTETVQSQVPGSPT